MMATNRIPVSEYARKQLGNDTPRNELAAAWRASRKLHGHAGMEIQFVLEIWSKRHPLSVEPEQVASMRAMLDTAGADECRRLFDEAI